MFCLSVWEIECHPDLGTKQRDPRVRLAWVRDHQAKKGGESMTLRKPKSRAQLEAELSELKAENGELQETVEELQGQLDNIAEIVSGDDDDQDS
jgi:hypothetical protein